MRAHVIKDGKVTNTIEVKSLDILPGLIDASRGGTQGDLWDGKVFTTPEPTPQERAEAIKGRIIALEAQQTPRRLREAVISGDKTFLADIETQIVALRAALP